ncbi:hypothetical protein ACFL6M_02075 [Candidatus Eisenbacteria bacterium]|uniref:ABC transporter substrate-binding protein n=1 Tax=Eiseniibacteriota bacterium TaxID=2212470 RepID=A0ABV6YJ65_UNCEI
MSRHRFAYVALGLVLPALLAASSVEASAPRVILAEDFGSVW